MKKNFEQNTEEEDEVKEPKCLRCRCRRRRPRPHKPPLLHKTPTTASSPQGRMELLSHKLELLPITKTQTHSLTHNTHKPTIATTLLLLITLFYFPFCVLLRGSAE